MAMLADADLVIFDCDGVLVDSERLTVDVEARMLTELGWPVTREEVIEKFMGRSLASEVADVEARLGPEAAAAFEQRLVPELTEAFVTSLVAIDGVRELLDALTAAGTTVCVASSGLPEGIAQKLDLTDLAGYFGDRVYSAVQVEHGKPAPDLFLFAAAALEVAPERCVVIEDSVHGAAAGVAAGMRTLAFAGGLADRAALAATGAELFDEMRELH